MVLYYSATGNTRFIAERLAELLGDETMDLLQRIRMNDHSPIYSERDFVICSPVYISEIPPFYAEFLKKVELKGSRNVYGILTNGGYSGIAGDQLMSIIRKKGLQFRGYAEFMLSGNHITNKSHRPLDDEEIRSRISAAADKTVNVAETIRRGETFRNRRIWLVEKAATVPVAPMLRHIIQTTKDFKVTDSCIACGKCERSCPLEAIQMRNGKPCWTKKRCGHCMACIQTCPVEAIEYGDVTQGRKRYSLERYK